MPKYDDLSAWKLFSSLVQSGSFSVTGDAFGVEPSTVSRAITALENSLGQKLFNRNERPLTLTEKGKWVARRIEPIISSHRRLIEALTRDNATLEGAIRLSVAPGFATRNLMPLLNEFSEVYPRISFDVLVGLKAADLKSQRCDVAVLTGPQDDPALVSLPRGRNIYLPVASPAYIQAHGMPLNPEDLSRHTIFIYAGPVRSSTRTLWKGMREAAVPFGKTLTSTDILSVREGVLNGYGISLDMPLVQCWEDIKEGRLVPILPGWRRPQVPCFVVLSKSSWHARRCRVFAEWFAQRLRILFRGFEEEIAGIVPLEPESRIEEVPDVK